MLAEWRLANPADDTANDEPPETSVRVPSTLQKTSSGKCALETKTPNHRQRTTGITRQWPQAYRHLDGLDQPRTEPVDEQGRSVNNHLALFG